MLQIKTTITGIAPILFHRMTEEVIGDVGTGKTGGRKSLDDKKKAARVAVYRNAEGLYCPSVNIKRAMITAASKASLKYGKKGLGQFLEALVFIDPSEVPFGVKNEDFIHEAVGRIPPGPRGARVLLYRAALNTGWKLSFTINVVDDRLPIDHIKQSLEEAGILCGLCDYRPQFGRFIVNWG